MRKPDGPSGHAGCIGADRGAKRTGGAATLCGLEQAVAVIFFFSFEVEPLADPTNWSAYGGGQFNCWIRADNATVARARALDVIASNGWLAKREDECREDPKGQYVREWSGLQYYEEAERDGEAFVVHTWPAGGGGQFPVH